MTEDREIRHRIQTLIDEEHELRSSLPGRPAAAAEDRGRLEHLEVELDQCWDLLRQRQARREYGADPESAQVRAPGVVEGYQSYLHGRPTAARCAAAAARGRVSRAAAA